MGDYFHNKEFLRRFSEAVDKKLQQDGVKPIHIHFPNRDSVKKSNVIDVEILEEEFIGRVY